MLSFVTLEELVLKVVDHPNLYYFAIRHLTSSFDQVSDGYESKSTLLKSSEQRETETHQKYKKA